MKRSARRRVDGRGAARFGAGLLLVLLTVSGSPDRGPPRAAPDLRATVPVCDTPADTVFEARTSPPEFYEIELVPTGNVTGTGSTFGKAEVRFRESPFDLAVSEDGTFHRQIRVDMTGLRAAPTGDYVVWATPPDLDPITKLGPLGEDLALTAEVAFPKFLLVVTLEEKPDEIEGRWSGPIVHRGMSRSGFMHTMAGHGPFQSEPCASYGFRP